MYSAILLMNISNPSSCFFHNSLIRLFFCFSYLTFSQNVKEIKIIDSLSLLDYNILNTNIKSNDSLLVANSLRAYLHKAERHSDTLKTYRAFLLLYKQQNHIKYLDNIIGLLHKSSPKFNKQLSIAYFGKGRYFYRRHQFNESLKNYLKANELLPGFDIDMNIGLIRNRIGEYDEALRSFQRIKNTSREKLSDSDWLWLLFALADTHRNLKDWDSTNFYVNLGHKEVTRTNLFERKPYFTLMQGANYYGAQKYHKSIDSMLSVSNDFIDNKDQANLMFNYYFIGISGYELGRKKLSLNYFKKLDSLYIITNHLEPEFRKAYEILISESSKNEDLNNQLKYVSRLLGIDSILTKDYRLLAKSIYQKYDSPKLLAEKQKLIKQISRQNSKTYSWLIVSLLSVFILGLIVVYFIKQNSKNKKKFERLLQNIEKRETEGKAKKTLTKKDEKLNINPEVVNMVLKKIDKFEKEKKFIKSDITLNNLARQFDTNSKYLSLIIKHFKHKSFSNYINSLRIEYAMVELKNNNEYKKYTLKAIANQFGFNSTESFSSAFFKRTGLKPSYFLKELWQKT